MPGDTISSNGVQCHVVQHWRGWVKKPSSFLSRANFHKVISKYMINMQWNLRHINCFATQIIIKMCKLEYYVYMYLHSFTFHSIHDLYTSFMSSIIMLPPILLITTLFMKAAPHPKEDTIDDEVHVFSQSIHLIP